MSKVKQHDTLQDGTCRVFKGKLREFVNCNLTFILLKIHTFGKCSGGLLYESKRRNLLHYMTADEMTQSDRVSADISCPQEVIPALTSLLLLVLQHLTMICSRELFGSQPIKNGLMLRKLD